MFKAYFSNFSNVDLKNDTSEGADYTMEEEMRNEYIRRFDQISRSFQSEENDFLNDDFIMDAAFSQFPSRSKTDNPRRLQEEIQKVNIQGFHHHTHPMINEEEELEHMIHHGINNLL